MARKPGKGHSSRKREPVTIELEAEKASPEAEANEVADTPRESAADEPVETIAEERAPEDGDHGSGEGDEPQDETGTAEPAAAMSAGQPKRSRFLPALGLGVVLALIGFGGAWYAGLVSFSGNTEVASLRAEIAALNEKVVSLQPAPADDDRIAALEQTIAGLSEDITTLREANDGGGDRDTAQKLAALESKLAEISLSSGNGSDEAIGAITSRIESAEKAAAAGQDAAAAAQSAADTAGGAVTGLSGRLADIEAKVGEMSATVVALSEKVARSDGGEAVARAVAATALKAAIDRGRPFMAELETFAAVSGGGDSVDSLREMAAAGVPTRDAIAGEMADAAHAMIAASNRPPDDAGLADRLLSSAMSLVESRPVGADVAGGDAGAVAARIEAAVNRGDYQAALAEYQQLPEPAKAAGADFIARVKARAEADALVEGVLKSALAARKSE